MKPEDKFRHAFGKFSEDKQGVLVKYSAFLGDGNGNVIVPGRINYVYAQVNGQIVQIKNTRVPPTSGLPVVVGYSPDEPTILKVLDARSTDNAGNVVNVSGGYAPASRYQWMAPGGGEDPLYVELRQILYGRLSGGVSGSPMAIRIIRNIVYTPVGWVYENSPITDLTGYTPSESGSALAALITSGSAGQVVVTTGSTVAIADLDLTKIPEPPSGTTQVYGAVRLYNGQTGIYEGRTNTDIIDLRLSGWTRGDVSGLTSVSHDGTLSGDGTEGNPLSVVSASGSGGGDGIYPQHVTMWHDEALITVGNAIVVNIDANQRYGIYSYQGSSGSGDTFTQPVMLTSGSFVFYALALTGPGRGLGTWALDGTTIGTVDLYDPGGAYNVVKSFSFNFSTSGRHVLSCTISKNASSSGYAYPLTKYWIQSVTNTTNAG